MRIITRLAFFFAILLLLLWSWLRDVALTNDLALKTTHALISSSQPVDNPQINNSTCRAKWIRGLLLNSSEDLNGRDAQWIAAGICDPNYVILMHRLAPEDASLASQILEAVPASAEAWFWMGNLDPEHAIKYYQRGLALSPKDARRWMTLAGLIESVDPPAALEALIQACEYGDPGENACLGAGNRFLAMGDVLSAIRILRKATWQGSLDLADRLEQEQNKIE